MKKYYGTWKTNNGNTWGPVITGQTLIGLQRILAKIIDGNLTGYYDTGRATIYASHEDMVQGLPQWTGTRSWANRRWHYDY